MKSKIKNLGAIALAVAFSFIGMTAIANDGQGDKPAAELKYIGNIKNQPVFQLDLASAQEKNFVITIKDVYGNVLYSERVKTMNYTRIFQLDTDEINDEVLRVEVTTDRKDKPEVFTINRNTRFVEEAVISKS